MQPPIEVVEYLGSPIHYNTDQLQPVEKVFCGHLFVFIRSQRARHGSQIPKRFK